MNDVSMSVASQVDGADMDDAACVPEEIGQGVVLRMRLDDVAERIRALALVRLDGIEGKYPVKLNLAMENVEPLNDFRFGSFTSMEDMDCIVFACGTVSVHTDEEAVPRYSNLLYLGTPEESGAIHRLHVIPRTSSWKEIDGWCHGKEISRMDMESVQTTVLERGQVVELDGHCPHWLTVELDGREYGAVQSGPPDLLQVSAHLVGLEPVDMVGLFAACAMDTHIPDDMLLEVFSSVSLPSPRIALGDALSCSSP